MGGVAAVQVFAAILATVLVVRYEEKRSLAMLEAGLVEHSAMVTSVIELPDNPTDSTIVHRELLTLPSRGCRQTSVRPARSACDSDGRRPAWS
jgi:hypothetical protein